MRSRDLIVILASAAAMAGLAVLILVAGKTYLPRHSDDSDLPFCRTHDASTTAKSEPKNLALSDHQNLLHPDQAFIHRELREGRFPLWNPEILGGVSLIKNPLSGVAYPWNLLASVLPPLAANVVAAALHLFLILTFTYLALRAQGVSITAALVGGSSSMLSGWAAAHLHNLPLVAAVTWVPLGFLSITLWKNQRSLIGLALLALAVSQSVLAGFPAFAIYGLIALALHALLTPKPLSAETDRVGIVRTHGGVLLSILAGGLLALPLLLPISDSMQESGHHGRSGTDLVSERFLPTAFLGLLLPSVLGDPSSSEPWDQDFPARLLLGQGKDVVIPPVMNWSERTIYCGALTFILALIGAVARFRRARAFLAILILGILLSVSPQVIGATSLLPGLNSGAPARAILLLALSLPYLAAFGADAVLKSAVPGRARLFAFGMFVFAIIALAFPLVSMVAEAPSREWVIECARSLGAEERFGVEEPRPVQAYLAAFGRFHHALVSDLLRFSLGVGLLGVVIFLSAVKGRGTLAAALLLLSIVIDLGSHLAKTNQPVSSENLFRKTPGLLFLDRELGDTRFARTARDSESEARDRSRFLVPNLGMIFGWKDAQGYREQIQRTHVRAWKEVSFATSDVGIAALRPDRFESGLLDLFRIRFLIAPESIPELAQHLRYPANGEESDLFVYENPGLAPRAFLVQKANVLSLPEIHTKVVESRFEELAKTVLLEEEPASTPEVNEAAPGTVKLVSEAPSTLQFAVDVQANSILVIPDAFDRGWKAFIRGQDGSESKTPVQRAYGLVRAVSVPPGKSIVVLHYSPTSFKVGLIVSIATGLAGVVTLFCFRRRRRAP